MTTSTPSIFLSPNLKFWKTWSSETSVLRGWDPIRPSATLDSFVSSTPKVPSQDRAASNYTWWDSDLTPRETAKEQQPILYLVFMLLHWYSVQHYLKLLTPVLLNAKEQLNEKIIYMFNYTLWLYGFNNRHTPNTASIIRRNSVFAGGG